MMDCVFTFCLSYLGHLPKYYRALQLFCSGMEDIYSYVAASANLEIMITPKLPVSNKQSQKSDATSQLRLQNKHFVNVPSSSLVGRILRSYSRTEKSQTDTLTETKIQSLKKAKRGRSYSGTEKSQTDVLTETKIQSLKNAKKVNVSL